MLKRILARVGVTLVILLVGVTILVKTYTPQQRPALDVKIQSTPELVARGDYLVNHELLCMECHAERDWTKYGGPKITLGAKGFCWTPEIHFPGRACAANITPDKATGLGGWTDGEILRAIREGVSRDGHALMVMPSRRYAKVPDADAYAVVAYLRTLPPVSWVQPSTELDFPVSFFVKLGPQPLRGPVALPPASQHGDYLAGVSLCKECHTPVDEKHRALPGMELAGGQDFRGPFGHVRSANLTPDETGQKALTKEAFLAMFAAFESADAARPIAPDQNTIMPWLALGQMKKDDLGTLYDYLHSLKPVSHKVEKRPGPS